MVTRTYRLDHDLGFAPNPYFGWCSLACCMPTIRKHAAVGDIIVGIAGSNMRGLGRIHPQLVYWMRVEEALTFDQYWHDPRFVMKRPRITGPKMHMVGDRTYRHEPQARDWSFELSMHYLPDAGQGALGGHVEKDTKVDRLLVGREFTYWGGAGPRVPDHLLELFPIRNQKCPPTGPALTELHDLCDIEHPAFVAGRPADWTNPKYFRG